METRPENKQASPQQERHGQTLLLSSLCLGPNQLLWAGSLHCATEQQIHGQTLFPLEESRLRVLIRLSTHGLIAQHTSKHQYFCHYLALILLSPHLCTQRCWQRVELQEETIPHLWGWGKEGQRQEKRCAQKGWLPPFQLPSQITSQKTHPCTFTFLLSFSLAFHSYKTRKNHSIARLFFLETTSNFTSGDLCFTLLKFGFCRTNKGCRNSLLHCQNWRISEIWGLDRWLGQKAQTWSTPAFGTFCQIQLNILAKKKDFVAQWLWQTALQFLCSVFSQADFS